MNEENPLQARFGRFQIDEAEARLERDKASVELAPRAFQVLCELVRRAGQLVSKETLLDAVWGHRHVNEAALKNLVSQLRQALGDDAQEPVYIQTVSRRGYRFIAPLGEPSAVPTIAPADPAGDWLVGRAAVLAQLRDALDAARGGQRQLVFIVGEAGIGKSSLVERFAATAGVRQALGQCVEHYGVAEPYLPVLEALNSLCRSDSGAAALVLMRRVAPTWLLQLPWFVSDEDRRELQREAAGATQDRMLREFGELVDRASAEQPLLLMLEDLQWSDHATVQLLGYLARRRGGSGALMLIGTFRPAELILQEHPLAALRQELRPRRLCLEIDLEFLSEADLGDLLQARLGQAAPEAFVRVLHSHTLGLPLFVDAVVEELRASGKLVPSATGWNFPDLDTLTVPRGIAGVIAGQIARLPAEQQRVLGAASVGGVDFLHLPLAEVALLPPEQVQTLLEDAAGRLPWLGCSGARALPDGRIAARYAFAHALYRQVLYERLPALQRMQWHRQWAGALAAAHANNPGEIAAELALHFERGEAPLDAAAQHAVVAARAMALGAPSEALQAARQGLQLAAGRMEPALEQDLRSLEAVALTRLHVLSAPEVGAAFERARALGPTQGPGWQRTLQGCWWVHFARAEFAQARTLAAEMQALATQRADPALRLAGLNAMGIVQLCMGEFDAARAQLESAIDAHASLPAGLTPTNFVQDPGVEAVWALVLVYWITGQPGRARQLAERAVAQAAASHHPLSEAMALYAAAILHSLAEEFETAYALTERLYALVRDQSLPEARSGFAWLHGHALVALGRDDEGLDEMRAAARHARQLGMLTGLGGFHYHYAQACRLIGLQDEAQASVVQGLAHAEAVGEQTVLVLLLGLQAEIEMAHGETDAAAASWQRAIATARAQGALFHELQVLASAQAHAAPAADPERLRKLLAVYDLDASPVVARARALLA
ncbi:AAA family ATPase [Paucibacter sp. XJ19-41]|uniref:AAA family ATPase n=1 Tax=Paucibacter sp. XJ19-41 TaxID=2927824 RepID=UPI002349CF2B|nr:AAA family ATPase [Paucibacter sp. XJ19-41]MDC6166618.1 AAA family ATPase [Paucibacter sp. XJ19-41]